MFRFNVINMARWNESSATTDRTFCRIHYGEEACSDEAEDLGEKMEDVWRDGCDAGMSWLAAGVRSQEALEPLFQGKSPHSWLLEETPWRYDLAELEGIREYENGARLFDEAHPVVCSNISDSCRDVDLDSKTWEALYHEHRGSDNKSASSEEYLTTVTSMYDMKVPLCEAVFVAPKLRGLENQTYVREVVFRAQKEIAENSGLVGRRVGKRGWAVEVANDDWGGSFVFERQDADTYCGRLAPAKICFAGDSLVREIATEFIELVSRPAEIKNGWSKKFGILCHDFGSCFGTKANVQEGL